MTSLFSRVQLPSLLRMEDDTEEIISANDGIAGDPPSTKPATIEKPKPVSKPPSRLSRIMEVLSPTWNRISSGFTPKSLPFSMFASFDIFEGSKTRNPSSFLFGSKRTRIENNFSVNEQSETELSYNEGGEESNELCPFFLKGGCRFRKNCRLSHKIGDSCPYCHEILPESWTQQSKHLKKCWENQIEDQELNMSMGKACQQCKVDVLSTVLQFGILNNCECNLCAHCAETRWSHHAQCIICPICNVASTCVMIRDRLYCDEERKCKMMGIYMKKLISREQRGSSIRKRSTSRNGSRRESLSKPYVNQENIDSE